MSFEDTIAVNETITAFLAGERARKLSLAVWVKDDYTDDKPTGRIGVFIKEIPRIINGKKGFLRGIINPEGYYLFCDLPEGIYDPSIESEYYFNTITSSVDPEYSFVRIITLTPKPDYPFPYNATLIRGMVVCGADSIPVKGAVVGIPDTHIKTWTTGKGEFVLYFKTLRKAETIIMDDGKTYVAGNPGITITVQATLGAETDTIIYEEGVEEGKTTILPSPIIIS